MRGPARWPIWPPGMCIAPGCSGGASAKPASPRSSALWRRSWVRSLIVPRTACSLSWTMAPPIAVQPAADRLKAKWPNTVLVHTPVHASWLNQIEVYFSIVQRKLLTPNEFPRPWGPAAGPDGVPKSISGSCETIQMDVYTTQSSYPSRQNPVAHVLLIRAMARNTSPYLRIAV